MPVIELDDAGVEADGPDGSVVVLRPLTLRLTEQRIGVIGSNGSGKSTFARLLNGLVRPTTGRVRVDGLDTASSGAKLRRRVGFVFTDPEAQLVMPTPAEDVALSLRRSDVPASQRRERALEVLDDYGLAERADISVHALSGGQKQLLALACVLATEPKVLVADEPTTLLDLRNTELLAHRLFSLSQQLVLVTHDLELAARCERVLVVDDGAIGFDGDPDEAIAYYRRLVSIR